MAIALMMLLLSTTAGLGVLALIELLLVAAIVASIFTERVVRHRSGGSAARRSG